MRRAKPDFRAGTRADRRRALLWIGVGTAAAALPGLAGCGHGDAAADDRTLALPLADVPPGRRVIARFANQPVEIVRTETRVVARSLVCTHMGCIVRWDPDRNQYICPCHDGRYDAEGRVLSGPPPLPLATFRAALTDTHVVVGP